MLAMKSAKRLASTLEVLFEDGLSAHYTYVWLRDNCGRRPSLIHLDLNSSPEEIHWSRQKLNVVWPAYVNSEYSCEFLRNHSSVVPITQNEVHCSKRTLSVPYVFQKFYTEEINDCLGTIEWDATARELGTLWPHLDKIPRIYTVESLKGPAKFYVVNVNEAGRILRDKNPEFFKFLTSSAIEYTEGIFSAKHNVIQVENEQISSVIFNNEARSSKITVKDIDMLYKSIKMLYEVCCNTLFRMEVSPGQRFIIDNAQTFIGAPAQYNRRLLIKICS